MSYRSIKRVLGETNLERKCRILFGVCLLLLITGAFWWVDSIAESLVIETTRSRGRDLVDIALLKAHFDPIDPHDDFKKLARQFSEDLNQQNYRSEILALNTEVHLSKIEAKQPSDEEKQILLFLQEELRTRESYESSEGKKNPHPSTDNEHPIDVMPQGDTPIFADRALPRQDQYHYYSPIWWRKSCRACHKTPFELGAVSAAEGGAQYGAERPLHVVRVTFPYKETQAAINKTRAILIAVAILTVFIAMIGLYVIVRYVIVKPLKHLRDVSDDISRGKTELRAVLNTGDEFEELAASFNRMMRHMTDAQAELRHVNQDLDGKVDELAQLNMRLHEMNQLKSEFLANMSHELRTPLNSIIGFSEVLQGIDSLESKQKRYAENIQKSGRVLLEMINDILDLAKMEAGKMELRPTEFDIATIVEAHCDMVRTLSEEKNIDVAVEVDTDAPPVYQDKAKVQQILTNLLSNAIKFTPEGGRITVSCQPDVKGRLELIVADTGVGIADEDREIIFEKFRQGPTLFGDDNLTREYSGTGLGLSIVKELCKLLGGEITFDSELGKGSTFKVLLPWTCANQSDRAMQIGSKLDELTRPQRFDFQRAPAVSEPPIPAAASTATVADQQS